MRRHRRGGGRVQASVQSTREEETDVIVIGAGLAGLAAAAALQKAGESVLHYVLHCIISGRLCPCTELLYHRVKLGFTQEVSCAHVHCREWARRFGVSAVASKPCPPIPLGAYKQCNLQVALLVFRPRS